MTPDGWAPHDPPTYADAFAIVTVARTDPAAADAIVDGLSPHLQAALTRRMVEMLDQVLTWLDQVERTDFLAEWALEAALLDPRWTGP